MRSLNCIAVCLVLLGAQCYARQITGRTNAGSFGPKQALLQLTVELSTATSDLVLTAGERGTIRMAVANVGGSAAEGVSVRVTSSVALQRVTIQPGTISVGAEASGEVKNISADVIVDRGAKTQQSVLSCQAMMVSGVKSQPQTVNLFVKERVAPVVVARDLTPPTVELSEPFKTTMAVTRAASGKPQFTTSASSITLKGIARDSSGVAIITVNGEEVKLTPGDRGSEFASSVLLAMGTNDIEIKAVDRFKNEGKMSIVILREERMIMGAYYALVIAIQDYQDPNVNSLQYPIQDGENLVNTLTMLYNFDEKNVTFLKNPNRSDIIKTFDELAKRLTEEDNVLIFYAGHGYWDERLKQGYWLPVDASQNTRSEWISNGTVRDYVAGMATKHTLLISDACFSGGIFKTRDAFSKVSAATRELYRLPSRKAMTSGAMKEVPDKSIFVEYLIKRLKENKEPLLPAEVLFSSFRQAVINNSPNRQIPQYGEIRETGDEGGDFIFVKK
jgi:archaellum component FlaG (FlaF/FlaG flagellin family)